jgi:hypothetical protein
VSESSTPRGRGLDPVAFLRLQGSHSRRRLRAVSEPLSTGTSTTDTDEGRVYLVERYIESQAAMHALAAVYAANSLQRGEPAILVSAEIAGSGR